jgi:adenylate cyclase
MSDPIAVSRRLVAVFAADVEGYSRLMGADEVGTAQRVDRTARSSTRVGMTANGPFEKSRANEMISEFERRSDSRRT